MAELLAAFADYIDNTDIPILAEFAFQNNMLRETIYKYDEFSTLRKRCIDKKEAMLERKGLLGEIDKSMAIFSLKQLGWSDRQAIEHSGQMRVQSGVDVAALSPDERRALYELVDKAGGNAD